MTPKVLWEVVRAAATRAGIEKLAPHDLMPPRMNNESFALPQPSGWDHAHVAVKAAISAIPIAGSPAAELFAAIIAPPGQYH
jgi:hypothetical protein